MDRSCKYARDISRTRQVRALCRRLRSRFVNLNFCLLLFFLAHLLQISIVLDIRKVDLVMQKKLNAIVAAFP